VAHLALQPQADAQAISWRSRRGDDHHGIGGAKPEIGLLIARLRDAPALTISIWPGCSGIA
jgi:hypothetical protein